MSQKKKLTPGTGDALLVVDVQNDFLPGGSLAVDRGDEVIPVLNRYIEVFLEVGLPVIATRDWHPAGHCSFKEQGGIWPPHCVQDTKGAAFATDLILPADAAIVSKATNKSAEAYSGFQGTKLAESLRSRNIRRVFIGGLATDYCVYETAKDALAEGFDVLVLEDAIRAVNVAPDDGANAMSDMMALGVHKIGLEALAASAQ